MWNKGEWVVVIGEEIDPFADLYGGGEAGSIWTRESEKVANPNAFTSDW